MLIPMVQANKEKAWRYAFICSLASILGGILGFFIGLYFFEAIAGPILEYLGKTEKMDLLKSRIQDVGGIIVFGAGLTPFPYKVITITSGGIGMNFFPTFIAASVLSRSLRFFLVAGVVKKFGDQAETIMKEHFGKFTMGLFILLILVYLAFKAIMHAMGLSH